MAEPNGNGLSPRSRLLAVLASQVAGGYAANPETSGTDMRKNARHAVDMAEAILDEVERREKED